MIKQPESTSQRVTMNTGILYAKMGVTVFISLYTTRLILNSLGANDFGIFNIVGGVISMLGFLDVAMAGATQRFMSHAKGAGDIAKQKNIFNVSIILHFIIAFLIGVTLLVAGYFFFNGVLNIPPERIFAARMVYLFMIASTMFTIMTVPYDATLNAHENMLYYAIVGIIESVLKLAVAIVVVNTLSDKLIVYGLLMACISFFVMMIMRIYCHKKYEECVFKPKVYFQKELMKEMTSFAGWNFIMSTVSILTNYGQSIVLNVFFGPIVNAAQGIASQVCGQVCVFSGNMLKALNPVIVKNEGKGDRAFMLKAAMVGSKIAFFLLMFFAVPVIVEMPYIFKIWLKNTPDYAVIFCRLLLLRFLLEQLFLTIESSIAAVGDIRNFCICQSMLMSLILPVGYIFYSYQFPPYVLHIIFLVSTCITFAIILFFAKEKCGLSISLFFSQVVYRCIIPFIITISISCIPLFFMESGLIRLCVVLSLNVLAYFGTVWLYGLTHDERNQILQLVSTIFKTIKQLRKK